MPGERLLEYLETEHIPYEKIHHERAFTAQGVAAVAHIPGKEIAKTVMIKVQGKMAMAVLPAHMHIHLDDLKRQLKQEDVALASEMEFKDYFPDCEIGAMPPFGNLYDMDVYVWKDLAEDAQIAFNAGTHSDLIRMSYEDFAHAVHPILLD